jgi:tetratricopeptide (TPR) repeat protein
VLSSGAFLGAREIQSMRVIPELVFVSAHLAAALVEGPVEGSGSFGVAAEFAGSLMAVGVRCVVVTALGVSEEAAVRFTTTLYRELLLGRRFADATATARAAAHELGGLTWAAYQCYGDPEWRLRRPAAESPQADRPEAEDLLRVSSASDLALALETITVNARLSRGTRDEHRATLTRLEERFDARWPHRGHVAEGFGSAWAAVGDPEKALAWFERALDASDGSASSRAAEQAASLRVRLAVANVEAAARQHESGATRPGRTKPIADRAYKEALKEARRAIERSLEQLQALAKERPTLERYSLCGNAYRRLAGLERAAGKTKEETKALEGMRRQFQAAEEIAHRTQDVNAYYPAMSRMEAELALNAGRTGWKGLHSSDIANARTSLTQLVSVEPDFWSVIALTELKLFEAISDRKLAQRRAGIAQELEDVHARASARPLWMAVQDRSSVVLGKYAERATPRERIAANGLRDTLAALREKTEAA